MASNSTVSKYFPVGKPTATSKRKVRNSVAVKYENIKEEPGVCGDEKGIKQQKWEPENWLNILENITKMRKQQDAAVDTMGCHKCYDEKEDPKTRRFQVLVALMLSSQTKDPVTFAAMQRLKEAGLSTIGVLSWSDEKFGDLIKTVGFWRKKVGYIKGAARMCEEEYNGDIPDTFDGLCKINGVGPKMAHLTMMTAWGKITGIAVDTHVHRISNRLKWTRKPCSDPKKTMAELEAWLPQEHWQNINHILVGFGQTVCRPVKPKCGECLNKDLCPASTVHVKRQPKDETHV